jgi:hypothetical protein
MKRERTAEEKVKALLDFLDEEEDQPGKDLPDLDGMSDAEVDKALAEAGIDVEAENRKADAEHRAAVAALAAERKEALPPAAPPEKVLVLPPRRVTRWAIPLAAAAAVLLLFAFEGEAIVAVLEGPSTDHRTGSAADPTELRRMARAELDKGRWSECLEDLDFAKRLDPAGDTSSDVVEMRHRAETLAGADGGKSE